MIIHPDSHQVSDTQHRFHYFYITRLFGVICAIARQGNGFLCVYYIPVEESITWLFTPPARNSSSSPSLLAST